MIRTLWISSQLTWLILFFEDRTIQNHCSYHVQLQENRHPDDQRIFKVCSDWILNMLFFDSYSLWLVPGISAMLHSAVKNSWIPVCNRSWLQQKPWNSGVERSTRLGLFFTQRPSQLRNLRWRELQSALLDSRKGRGNQKIPVRLLSLWSH